MKMPGRGPHVYPRLPSAVNRRDFLLLFSSGMDCHRRTSIGIPYMKQSGTRHHGSAALVRRWLAEEDEHRRVREGRKGEQQREREEKANAEHEGEGEALHIRMSGMKRRMHNLLRRAGEGTKFSTRLAVGSNVTYR